jgi:hypothetical protein
MQSPILTNGNDYLAGDIVPLATPIAASRHAPHNRHSLFRLCRMARAK